MRTFLAEIKGNQCYYGFSSKKSRDFLAFFAFMLRFIVMLIILNAVFPTIVLLVLGNIFRRSDFLAMEFWTSVDKLTYFILFPALLIAKVSQVDLSIVNFSQIFLFIGLYFAVMSVVAFAIFRVSGRRDNQFSSIYQGVVRMSTYILFAVVEAGWGANALALAALFSGIVIPIINVCCVASFALGSGRFSLKNTLLSIVKNPLIISSLLGFICNLVPQLLPTVLLNSLDILGKAALPLALLSVGAAVRVKMLWKKHENFSQLSLWLSTLGGLVIAPIVAYVIAVQLGIVGDVKNVLILFAAVPTATSSFILAKQLGGDADLMATLISLQTVLSMLTLSLWLMVLM